MSDLNDARVAATAIAHNAGMSTEDFNSIWRLIVDAKGKR